jgi:hypothetical protein
MAKTLCDIKHREYIKSKFDTYRDLIHPGKYVCKNCGRVAVKKKYLCNPKKLYKKEKTDK